MPTAFRSVTPRMLVNDVEAEVAFLHNVFGAIGEALADRPAEIRIGDSVVMVSSAAEAVNGRPRDRIATRVVDGSVPRAPG